MVAGCDAGAGGVERELADRDAHAAGALVAEPEDALAVAHHDHLDLVEARMGEDLLDPMSRCGQLRNRPRGFDQMWLKRWQPSPTVGV